MIYDQIEAGRHKITMVMGMLIGRTTYWCEGCGAIFIIKDGEALIFQEPAGSTSKLDWCSRKTETDPLREKIEAMDRADYERMRDI